MVKLKVPYWLAQKNAHPMVIEGTVKKETDKAYLFSSDHGDLWYPKSQVKLLEAGESVERTKDDPPKPKRETYVWSGNLDEEWEEFTVFIDPFNSKKVKITVEILEDG